MASLRFEQDKDPQDIAPYAFNFSEHVFDEYEQKPDPLVSCVIRVLDEDASLQVDSYDVIGSHAVTILSGGQSGTTYTIECLATFESGKVLNRSSKLKVKDL